MRLLRLAALAFLVAATPAFPADHTVYLTFDDGQVPGTANILDALEAENVPAAMFMVGIHAQASPDQRALVARAKAIPHVTVGNHCYSHTNNHKAGEEDRCRSRSFCRHKRV